MGRTLKIQSLRCTCVVGDGCAQGVGLALKQPPYTSSKFNGVVVAVRKYVTKMYRYFISMYVLYYIYVWRVNAVNRIKLAKF